MQLNSSALVFVTLLGSGCLGGFCVSNGSGHYLGVVPIHTARHKGSGGGGRDYNAEIAAGILAANDDGSGGGDDGGPSEIVRLNSIGAGGRGGGGGGGGGPSEPPTIRTFGFGKVVPANAADPQPRAGADVEQAKTTAASPGGLTLAGDEGMNVLAGNSVKRDHQDGTVRYTYFAPRGWQADGDGHEFVVRRWSRGAGAFCEPKPDDPTGRLVCTPIEIRHASTQDGRNGSQIGVVRVGAEDWGFLVKGNVASFPDRLPSLDRPVVAAGPIEANPRLTASGKAVWMAMQGQIYGIGGGGADRPLLSIDRDGRVLRIEAHGPAAVKSPAGVAVLVERWSFERGVLCQIEVARTASRQCWRPESYGPNLVHLVPETAPSKPTAARLASPASKIDAAGRKIASQPSVVVESPSSAPVAGEPIILHLMSEQKAEAQATP